MFLQFHMSNIEAFLKELEELLLDSACPASTYYYAIEPVLKEQEEELIEHGYSSINVDMFTGQEAILKIIDEHKNVSWINLKQNQKIKKLPDVNKVFCDNIHFTKYGNILVSELIKNYLINR